MSAATQQIETFAEAAEVLRKAFPDTYEERPQQVKMATAVEITLGAKWDQRTEGPSGTDWDAAVGASWELKGLPPTAAVQAGCGTGKSHALFIPALLWVAKGRREGKKRRVVVSTSTKALQYQIMKKDVPFLVEHLGGHVKNFPKVALLMGRGNYLCAAKLAEGPAIPQLTELQAVQADKDAEGTRDSIDIEITAEQWGQVSSTGTECPGAKQCPFALECKSEAAKKEAAEAGVVVTNAACLGLDMVLSESMDATSGPMLGEYHALMCDEADGLDQALRNVLATRLNERGLMMLASGAETFVRQNGQMDEDTLKQSKALVQALQGLSARLPYITDEDRPKDDPKGGDLDQAWFTDNSDPVDALIRALQNLSAVLRLIEDDSLGPKEKNRRRMLVNQADNAAAALEAAQAAEDGEMACFNTWNVVRAQGAVKGDAFFTVEIHPVAIANRLRQSLWSKQRTVLTSATLTGAPNDFSYFTRTLGLEHAATLDVGTPFNYLAQAKIFVPGPKVPAPLEETKAAWTAYAINKTLELVKMAGGGALLLYTSRDAMVGAHAVLAHRMEQLGLTVLIQDGNTPTSELSRRFLEDGNAVLFGLKTFFVGFDAPGRKLRLVIMDKLPFPVPVEPVFKARRKAIEKAGGNSFISLSMPMMTLDLNQAFGRLIRTKTDQGVVAILDSRLSSKWYGPQILAGLPDCLAENDEVEIEKFFQAMAVTC